MIFDWLLRNSREATTIFFVLVVIAVATQLTKNTTSRALPFWVRALLKALPALFLTALSWSAGQPLVALMFLFCSVGDILIDLHKVTVPYGFLAGAASFSVALIIVCILSYQHPLQGHPLLPLSITNIVFATFVLRRVLPTLHGARRILAAFYFAMLIVTNVFASTSYVPVFLGSSLWFMSDLSIGAKISGESVNSFYTLGIYHLGLYFLALGFLNAVSGVVRL